MKFGSKKIRVLSISLVFLLAGGIFLLFKPDQQVVKLYENKLPVSDSSAFYAAGPIFLNNNWEEAMTFQDEIKISEIHILTATYARINQGILTISLKDEAGKVRVSDSFDLSAINDNSYIKWKFKSQRFSTGETISVLLESNAKEVSDAIAVYVSYKKNSPTIVSKLSGKEIPGSGVLKIYG
jgi:hypothetical protein